MADGGWRALCNQPGALPISHRGALNTILLPWCQQHSLPVMAYCPLAQAGRLRDGLFSIAISLIWLTRGDYGSATAARLGDSSSGVLAIPKAASIEHVVQNAAALDIVLSGEELAQLDRLYPPPQRKTRLDMV
ncbi:putative an aldehyde reductase [Klebsiella pneumoniae]|uniref:Putative an aldehyde reductase n=1 Tax=Klebsiella pneumoniae TaxID=573 RepID=A0A377V3K7_KLEPN|nr:putative an aldehyde reductase [Klebsiella pneumoniae]